MRARQTIAMILTGLILTCHLAAAGPEAKPKTEAAKPPAAKPKPKPKPAPGKPKPKPKPTPAKPKPAPKPAPAPTKEQQAEKLFESGRDALFRGRYKEAAKLLAQAADKDKTKTRYRLYLARAHRYAGNSDEAERLLQGILKASADHVEAGQMLALMLSEEEKWDRVVKVLQPLLRYRHDYPTYHMLAEAQYNLDKYDEARKHFREAIRLNPTSAVDHYQLGNIHLANNAFALAADAYQKALALGLKSPVLHYKLGSAYFNLRNYFGRVSEVSVKSGKVATISGPWYLIEAVPGKTDVFRVAPSSSAVYQVAKAVETGLRDERDIRFLRANIYLNARRYAQAYEMLKQIAAVEPKDAKASKEDRALFRYYFAQAAFGVGKYDEYLKLLREAIKLDAPAYEATLVDAYLKVAEQHNQRGDLAGYIKYLKLAVAEAPKKVAPHLKLGYAYEEAHQYPDAIIQWRMVLDLEPDHAKRMALLELIRKYRPAAKKGGGNDE